MRIAVLVADGIFVSFWIWLVITMSWVITTMMRIYNKHLPHMKEVFGQDWSIKTHPETLEVFKGLTSEDVKQVLFGSWWARANAKLDSVYMAIMAPDCGFLCYHAITQRQIGWIIWWGFWTGVFVLFWVSGPGGTWRKWKKQAKEQVARVGDKLVVIPVRTQE